MKYSEKTIPYRLSPAELENLRMLRRRTGSPDAVQGTQEEKRSVDETDSGRTDSVTPEKNPVRKSS